MMPALPARRVPNQPELAPPMKNRAAMDYRLRQPLVAIMTRIEQIERASRDPPFNLHRRHPPPTKGLFALGLIEVVDTHSVVRRCPTIPRTLGAFANILVGAWVHQEDSAVPNQLDAERIRVAMPRTMRPGIDKKLLACFHIRHEIQAAVAQARGFLVRITRL